MTSLYQRVAAAFTRSAAVTAVVAVALLATLAVFAPILSAKEAPVSKPTVVLVHGAFAECSRWNAATLWLLAKGYPVGAAANPLSEEKSDVTCLANVLDSISGPVTLVGHSDGGNVISGVPTARTNVKALIYAAGVAPDVGESGATLSGKLPGSSLGPTLAPPVTLADSNKDLYIHQDRYPAQFAADVPLPRANLMATP